MDKYTIKFNFTVMLSLSVVIITKNEEQNIARCLKPLIGLTDDILIIDNGSNDKTIEIAQSLGAKIIHTKWQGYAQTKNFGNEQAKYNWILSLDADEEINDVLKENIIKLFTNEPSETFAFMLQRKMIYCGKLLNFGAVGNEFRVRIFNKKTAQWNTEVVHENIIFSKNVRIEKLNGWAFHYSYKNEIEHQERLKKYANLFAKNYTKKPSLLKLYVSPMFGFIRNYIFKAGFLDGRLGYQFAKNEMEYTKLKYEL